MDLLKKYNPNFRHLNDAVAFAAHLTFLKEGYKLVGLNEEQYLEDLGSVPDGWNKVSELYTFKYIKPNNNKITYIVKILSMGDNDIVISAAQSGSDLVYTLDINISDHIHLDNNNLGDYSKLYKDIDSLLLLINSNITNKFNDNNNKNNNNNNNEQKDQNNKGYPIPFGIIDPDDYHPRPFGRPNVIDPYGGGDFDDDLNPFNGGFHRGGYGRNGGDHDLDPLGGGGNLMGPQHPRFGQPIQPNNRPPLNVPRGARFDPYGPGPLGNIPGPNNDHFPPPRGGNGGGGGGLFM